MTRGEMLARAAALFRHGDTAAAIPAYERLLHSHPDLPDSWFNLGILYRRCGRFDDAMAAYDQALAQRVRDPHEVLVQQAVILSEDLARPADARRLLERATAQAPGYLAAWLNLGNLAEELGDVDAARKAYARARAIDPRDGLALARLLGVAGAPAGLIDDARRFLSQTGDVQARADVGFALGGALDKVGDYDGAFDAYVEANGQSRAFARQQGVRYDRAALEAYVERSIAAFDRFDGEPASGVAPVFVCGMFRSGSTLVEHLLARHPAVVAGGEIDALPRLASALFANDPARVAAANDDLIARARASYGAAVAPRRAAGRRLIDKRPDNVLHLGLAQRLFPGATIVNTVRHPADVCLSVYFLHAGAGVPYATDLGDTAHYWRQQRRLMRHWRAIGMPVHTVDYDRLVETPKPVLAALSAACDLPAMDLLALPPATHAVRTASVAQVRRPLYRESSGRWRHYARRIEPVLGALIEEERE
ncbi:tetratricopeptide repeat-containing sulfotransferase family protein [Sphingomonas corticis]|jgi:tetratricopeptide (TPR) repeat protein|uniref:Tetratricopeptide repeat protein n=1 Tax=Sphingomonas corticis TaxID=2722791 RepID=A0ABX1CPU9_9SPHN|nr:sulfotransferase [Sphingomonas corticis]NJR78693.1 tetratricopeptide repeat protein [Sphingomonas corticis]